MQNIRNFYALPFQKLQATMQDVYPHAVQGLA
jgi:hypothetical protein